ncbi:hypothetical protein HPB51_018819 [Rhipicephalus microplus]|uniref:Uncharacterized protein n=1 Tax=Rhipicephalus microplus TaxID=6941 RepID=A0A9J6DBB1_RHIMP|nr:hypothetical protein HPB51_018819 [Rhipicephalus microplus]
MSTVAPRTESPEKFHECQGARNLSGDDMVSLALPCRQPVPDRWPAVPWYSPPWPGYRLLPADSTIQPNPPGTIGSCFRHLISPLKLWPRPERGHLSFRSWLPAVPAGHSGQPSSQQLLVAGCCTCSHASYVRGCHSLCSAAPFLLSCRPGSGFSLAWQLLVELWCDLGGPWTGVNESNNFPSPCCAAPFGPGIRGDVIFLLDIAPLASPPAAEPTLLLSLGQPLLQAGLSFKEGEMWESRAPSPLAPQSPSLLERPEHGHRGFAA